MNRILGPVLAGGLILVMAGKSDAQVAVSIGNPYLGRGVYVGAAPAYGYVPPPVVGGVYVGAPVVPPVYAVPPVGLGVGIYGYPRYPVYRPYYGPRYHYGPYRRW
jgi:hypothetical protein